LGEAAGGVEARWSPGRVLTFEEAAERALELMANRTRERTTRERRRILEADLLPAWSDRAVTDIRRADVAELASKIAARGSPVMANRTLSMVRALFNAMLDLELVEANPATRPDRFMRGEKPRERALGRDELRAILKAAEGQGPEARAFFGLVAHTVQRAGAVAAARWEEFNGDAWTIPPEERRKFKGYARTVPINVGAQSALRVLVEEAGVQGPYLFPSREGAREPHWTNWNRIHRRLRREAGVDGWSLHDLRATFRTNATRELEIPAEVADAVLGHAIPTVGHVHYEADKSTYLLAEKREALQKWDRFLREVVEMPRAGE
jgi:integrase